jgi:hypothetical protein
VCCAFDMAYGWAFGFAFFLAAGAVAFFVCFSWSRVRESAALKGYSRTDSCGRLAGVTQSDVHAAIAGHDDHQHVIEHSLPILRTQLGIPFNRIFYLLVGEVFLFAECLGLDVGGRNSLCDQESLDSVHAPLGERPDCIPRSRAGRHGLPESGGRPACFEDRSGNHWRVR